MNKRYPGIKKRAPIYYKQRFPKNDTEQKTLQ
jgi:hypothetical protein